MGKSHAYDGKVGNASGIVSEAQNLELGRHSYACAIQLPTVLVSDTLSDLNPSVLPSSAWPSRATCFSDQRLEISDPEPPLRAQAVLRPCRDSFPREGGRALADDISAPQASQADL